MTSRQRESWNIIHVTVTSENFYPHLARLLQPLNDDVDGRHSLAFKQQQTLGSGKSIKIKIIKIYYRLFVTTRMN